MARCSALLFVCLTLLVPKLGNAQVYQRPSDPPTVTAAGAAWQIAGEPVFYAGDFYYPAGPTVYFDGFTMIRSGVYRGVPLFVDTTLEPYSIVYVPIGGKVMRPYERRRAGEMAGTVGSRPPAFPIQRDSDVAVSTRRTGLQLPERGPVETPVLPEAGSIGTGGAIVPRAPGVTPAAPVERPSRVPQPAVQSIPGPQSNAGIWIDFAGARWYAAGPAVAFSPDRFTRIGERAGFPVYRDRTSTNGNEIYVPAVQDGPVAPFVQR